MINAKLPATERVIKYQFPQVGGWNVPSEKGELFLADELIPVMTQDKLAGHQKDGIHALSMLGYFDLFEAMYDLRNAGGDVEKARQFIRISMRNSFPNTLTRLVYTLEGTDRIVHGYGTESPIEKQVDLVGSNGDVGKVLISEASLALTGKSPEQVVELMQYINGTPTYIWRVSNKPKSVDERVARFYADSGGAGLDCDRDPQYLDASLGVRREKI